jgi:uncharacterized protein YggE
MLGINGTGLGKWEKRILVICTCLVLLSLTGLLVGVVINQFYKLPQSNKEIVLTGSSSLPLKDKETRVSITVSDIAAEKQAAYKNVATKTAEVMSEIKKAGIGEDKVVIGSFYTDYNYDEMSGNYSATAKDYRSTQQITVRVADSANLSTLLDVLSKRKDVTYSINNYYDYNDKSMYREQIAVAEQKAIEDAKSKAENLNGTLGTKIGKVLWFKVTSSGVTSDASSVYANVEIKFELK